MIIIPTTEIYADYEQESDLGDETFVLRFTWNTRDESWYMSVSTPAGDLLVAGVRVRANYSILQQFRREAMPAGILMAINPRGNYTDPGRNDFLESAIVLSFITNAEIAAL